MPKEYASSVAEFLKSGRVIAWGIVPTELAMLSRETPETLAMRLVKYWEVVSQTSDLSVRQIAEQALLAPARCCIKDMGATGQAHQPTSMEEKNVNKAFAFLGEVSRMLKDRYNI